MLRLYIFIIRSSQRGFSFQPPREEPSGASTVTVDVEPAPSDIQLNPGRT